MQHVELEILLLDDENPPTAAFNRIDTAMKWLADVRGSIEHGRWKGRFGSQQVSTRVTHLSNIEDIDRVLRPPSDSARAQRDRYDLILLDNAWKGGTAREGLDHLQRFPWQGNNVPLLALFTDHDEFQGGFVDAALAAGADAVVKKSEPIHFINLIHFAAKRQAWRSEQRHVQKEVESLIADPLWAARLCAQSEAMLLVLREVVAVAAYDHTPVLLEGSVGTGKTLMAELIHAMSRRASGPFVSAYLNQMAPDLVQGELFGKAKGGATGVEPRKGLLELAERGTLFIDELQSLYLPHQEILKNVIEHRKYRRIGDEAAERSCDVRFVLATNESVESLVESGRMKRDFVGRVDEIKIRIPDLSDRVEDIPALARAAAQRFWAKAGSPENTPRITEKAMALLRETTFPDNVRGLMNMVSRACRRAGTAPELLVEHFDVPGRADVPAMLPRLTPGDYLTLARLGPRDSTSQRRVFDLLVGRAPQCVTDTELQREIEADPAGLHVVISRLRSRLQPSPYRIERDSERGGYMLLRESA